MSDFDDVCLCQDLECNAGNHIIAEYEGFSVPVGICIWCNKQLDNSSHEGKNG